MIIEGPLINATFISRPNRFVVIIKINNKLFKSHLADPGRLKELLTPNANLLTNTLNFLSPSFSQILEPGSQYTGLEYFFA